MTDRPALHPTLRSALARVELRDPGTVRSDIALFGRPTGLALVVSVWIVASCGRVTSNPCVAGQDEVEAEVAAECGAGERDVREPVMQGHGARIALGAGRINRCVAATRIGLARFSLASIHAARPPDPPRKPCEGGRGGVTQGARVDAFARMLQRVDELAGPGAGNSGSNYAINRTAAAFSKAGRRSFRWQLDAGRRPSSLDTLQG